MAAVTDEPLDAYFNRPVATWLVRVVAPTPITPNQLTFLSLLLGTVGAAFIAASIGRPRLALLGAMCLVACMVFDCADGQLARLRGGGSVLGRIIDGYADYWVALLVHIAILRHVLAASPMFFGHRLDGLGCFLFVLLSGASMAVHAGRFDHHKHRFLAHTGRGGGPELPEPYLEEARRTRWVLVSVALRLFALYLRTLQGPAFHAAAEEARATASDPRRIEVFERENALFVRLFSVIGPTMHTAAIGVACCLAPFVEQPFVWYCAFVLVGVNFYGLALHVVQAWVVHRERGTGPRYA